MAMNNLCVLILIVFLSRGLASPGSLAGQVTTKTEPLAGVNVILQGTVRGTTTDSLGQFRLADIPAGMYTVVFSSVGFQRQTRFLVVNPTPTNRADPVCCQRSAAFTPLQRPLAIVA